MPAVGKIPAAVENHSSCSLPFVGNPADDQCRSRGYTSDEGVPNLGGKGSGGGVGSGEGAGVDGGGGLEGWLFSMEMNTQVGVGLKVSCVCFFFCESLQRGVLMCHVFVCLFFSLRAIMFGLPPSGWAGRVWCLVFGEIVQH